MPLTRGLGVALAMTLGGLVVGGMGCGGALAPSTPDELPPLPPLPVVDSGPIENEASPPAFPFDAESDDASFPFDAGTGMCPDDTPYAALPWVPPSHLNQGACSPSQITAYLGAIEMGTSMNPTSGSATCDACLQTDEGAAAWGPVISVQGQPEFLNVGGCIASFDGMTGAASCGDQLNNYEQCTDQECADCDDFTSNGPESQACQEEVANAGGACSAASLSAACQTELQMDGGIQVCFSIDSVLAVWCGGAQSVEAGAGDGG